jgi:hypothetical protein
MLTPQDAIMHMRKDFLGSEENTHSTSGVKPICWTGIKHMISEVSEPSIIPYFLK